MKRQLPEGFDVHYEHQRYRLEDVQFVMEQDWDGPLQAIKRAQDRLVLLTTYKEKRENVISPTGGITYAHVFNGEGFEVATGKSRCSLLDNFDKKIGRDIALGRALKTMS